MSKPAYLQRVEEEKKDLDVKIQKIRAFDTSQLDQQDRSLLIAQESIMTAYRNILQQRVDAWERREEQQRREERRAEAREQ